MASRTGPIGRIVRIVIGVAALGVLSTVVDQGGPASFRDSSNTTDPMLWVLQGAVLFAFVMFAGQIGALVGGQPAVGRWQALAIIGLSGVVVVAALAAMVRSGSVWMSPLPEIVWLFDVIMLFETALALLIASALGTPGCEVGVWPELLRRLRGGNGPTGGPSCPIGLHLLDEWETERSRARPS